MNGEIALVIPALNPEPLLAGYVKEGIQYGFSHIIVVDDGSGDGYADVFMELETFQEVAVLRHGVNRGKGRALKTALAFCLEKAEEWGLSGIIAVDSDGQHKMEDVCRVAEAMDGSSLVLGCRDLLGENVPPKSRFGNLLTCRVFRLLYGTWISDTQTGLRGIPLSDMELFLKVPGERYEYETEMLIAAVKNQIPIREISIETIYIDDNAGTHFRPVVDSVKIYAVMLKCFLLFTLFSLSSFVLDVGVFALLDHVLFKSLPHTERIFFATGIARIISSVYNFAMNRTVVFEADGRVGWQIVKYYCLAAVQMLASAGLVTLFVKVFPFTDTTMKMIVDICLFFLSFQIQKRWIFTGKQDSRL